MSEAVDKALKIAGASEDPTKDPENWKQLANGKRQYKGPMGGRDGRFGLTDQQMKFVIAYCGGSDGSGHALHDAAKAAKMAGYEGTGAAGRLMKNAKVLEAIRTVSQEAARANSISPEAVIGNIARIGNKAEQDESWGAALKAQELLGKTMALFSDRLELVRSVEEIEDDELDGLLNEVLGKMPTESAAALTAALAAQGKARK